MSSSESPQSPETEQKPSLVSSCYAVLHPPSPAAGHSTACYRQEHSGRHLDSCHNMWPGQWGLSDWGLDCVIMTLVLTLTLTDAGVMWVSPLCYPWCAPDTGNTRDLVTLFIFISSPRRLRNVCRADCWLWLVQAPGSEWFYHSQDRCVCVRSVINSSHLEMWWCDEIQIKYGLGYSMSGWRQEAERRRYFVEEMMT